MKGFQTQDFLLNDKNCRNEIEQNMQKLKSKLKEKSMKFKNKIERGEEHTRINYGVQSNNDQHVRKAHIFDGAGHSPSFKESRSRIQNVNTWNCHFQRYTCTITNSEAFQSLNFLSNTLSLTLDFHSYYFPVFL